MVNLFFPYYRCGDNARQAEIDHCLQKNIQNKGIDCIYLVIDDDSECPIESKKVVVINIDKRLTYKYWYELTARYCKGGISLLCNSDIYFDDTINLLDRVLVDSFSFLALSRWELVSGAISKHPNPHWSQDAWAMRVGSSLTTSFLHQIDFPMGVPRCDNKIAYLFSTIGWKLFNPVNDLRSIHVHETQMRTYDKKLDDRILGGVAYVHPGEHYTDEAVLDFDIWTKRTSHINKLTINKAMEKWIKESREQKAKARDVGDPISNALMHAKTSELFDALKANNVLKSFDISNKIIEHKGEVYFKKIDDLFSTLKVSKQDYEQHEAFYTVAGFIPPTLEVFVSDISLKPKTEEDVNFWQYPCATEKQAYDNHRVISSPEHVDYSTKVVNLYLPLPWATYIDKKAFPETYLEKIKKTIQRYDAISKYNDYQLKVHTVCQHIHWIRILDQAEWLGVTDLYLSHKDSKSEATQKEVGTSLRLHGWMLIAVNYETPERSLGMERKPAQEKGLLASFIGAHMPHYRDDSRVKLFEAAKSCGRDDVFVDLGNEWHFNKVVYEEQVLNLEVAGHHVDEHQQKTFRYNSILSDSKFSLCPEGAGPNTLRFWESIAVGSIPVIFSGDLAAFRELSFGAELLENVILWDKGIGPELFIKLTKYNESELSRCSSNLIALYSKISKFSTFDRSAIAIENQQQLLKLKAATKQHKKINILYIGASVTAQKNGYRSELNKLLNEQGYIVEQTVLATGATGSIFGLCNLSTLSESISFDMAIYEYSTGDLNVGLTPVEVMEDIVRESLEFLSSIAGKVVLINNYRSDFEGGAGDFVRDKHRSAAKSLNVQVIDMYVYFESIKASYSNLSWKAIYRDNVHTGDEGSVILAKKIQDELGTLPVDVKKKNVKRYDLASSFYYPDIEGLTTGCYTYPSSGQKFKYIEVDSNTVVKMKVKGEFWGMISIVGPTSGWVEVKVNGTIIQKFCQLDAHCYYERIQPRQFMRKFEGVVDLTISVVEEGLDFSVVKQPHNNYKLPRQLKLSCLMGRNLEIQDVNVTGVDK